MTKSVTPTTAINLHNYTDRSVCGTLRLALDYTLEAPETLPTFEPKIFEIAPLRTLEIDCNTLWATTRIEPGAFMKGMVDIGLATNLPAVAVYTAEITDQMGITNSGAGISIDVEYLTPFIK